MTAKIQGLLLEVAAAARECVRHSGPWNGKQAERHFEESRAAWAKLKDRVRTLDEARRAER